MTVWSVPGRYLLLTYHTWGRGHTPWGLGPLWESLEKCQTLVRIILSRPGPIRSQQGDALNKDSTIYRFPTGGVH